MKVIKVDHLSNDLETKIRRGEYKYRQKLPSVNKLAKLYNVSTVTANLALARLKSNSMIESQKGSGTYVTYKKFDNKDMAIGLVCIDVYAESSEYYSGDMHPVYINLLQGLQEHFLPPHSMIIPLKFHEAQLADPNGAVRVAIERKKVDGLVVSGVLTPQDVDYLNSSGIPYVTIGVGINSHTTNVSTNSEVSFRLLMKHLKDSGHEKVLFIGYRLDPQDILAVPFYKKILQTSDHGSLTKDELFIVPNIPNKFNEAAFLEIISNAINCNSTAIVTMDDVIAKYVWHICFQKGLNIPQDISLASMVDGYVGIPAVKLTAVNRWWTIRESAYIAAQILERAINGENVSMEKVIMTPSLVLGDSTKSIS